MKNKKPESVTKQGPEQNMEKTHEGRAAIATKAFKEKEQPANRPWCAQAGSQNYQATPGLPSNRACGAN